METTIKFLGGTAGKLTGSCYLLTININGKNIKIVIDVGLIQGDFKKTLEQNKEILNHVNPAEVDFICLTHGHIDHTGRVPFFVKNGFRGKVVCTHSTLDLLGPMLEDSAKIQKNEIDYLNKMETKLSKDSVFKKDNPYCRSTKGNRGSKDRHQKETQEKPKLSSALYDINDVKSTMELIKESFDYNKWIKLTNNIKLKFYPSGHVVGGAIIVIKISDEKETKCLCFTGDLGRKDGIILPPPEIVKEPIDYLITESTYGGKVHPEREKEIKKLLELILESTKKHRKIIIPSFALERSQEIIYLLSYYMKQGVIPKVQIYLDSPLALKITEVFAKGWAKGMFSDQDKLGFNPFCPQENEFFRLISERKESDELMVWPGNYIVIAGSGMCDAGRIRGYLRNNLSKTNTDVFLVGYMAEKSLGGRIKRGDKVVKMNKEEIEVKAKIISFNSFSAHADGAFIVEYIQKVLQKNPHHKIKKIFIVHGEEKSAGDLKIDLEKIIPRRKTIIPGINDEFTLK